MNSASRRNGLCENQTNQELIETNSLIQGLLKLTEAYESNISESSDQSSIQVEKTKKIIQNLLELSRQIKDPANNVCADISSKAFSIIWDTVKNQEFYVSQLAKKNNEISKLKTQVLSLDKKSQNLFRQANYDNLTWLGNRYLLELAFDLLVDDFDKNKASFSMAMIDIDDFKLFNVKFWYTVWDKVLKFMSDKLKEFFVKEWTLFRYWGEEFIIITQLKKEELFNLIERFRKKFIINQPKLTYRDDSQKIIEKAEINVTFSWWIVEYKKDTPFNKMVEKADLKLNQAKKQWKNKIIK